MVLPTTRWRSLVDTVVGGLVLPPDVFEAMVLVESNGDPNARSASDARGLAQLIPRWHKDGIGKKVAAELGKPLTDSLWFDPEFSLRCGSRHLAWCFTSDGSRGWERAVRKYFSGTADPPAGFADAQGTSVERHIRKFRDALVQVREDRQASPSGNPQPQGETSAMANHTYVFSMGHRNSGPDANGNPARGGAQDEAEWTPECTRIVGKEFRARGAKVFIAQEEDGDDDPNDSWPMKRQPVAELSARLAQRHGAVAYLSFHYNGSGGHDPGFHAVVANRGSRTFASNAKDVKLAKAIATRIKASNTVSIRRDGVFPESDAGALAHDRLSRLGEMAGTFSVRETTVRLILEAADFSTVREREFLQDDNWIRNVYAFAIADACAEIFGAFPNPDGHATGGGGFFAEPSPVPELEEFVANGALVKTPPAVVTLSTGEKMTFVNKTAKAIRDTPRRQFGRQNAPSVGPDLQAGQTFNVAWKYKAADNNSYFLTPFWTRIDAADVEVTG